MAAESAEEIEVRRLLTKSHGDHAGANAGAFSRDGMSFVELVRLDHIIRKFGIRSALEVGMATGTSSVVICEAIRKNGGGGLTSIDPFQNSSDGYGSAGINSLRLTDLLNCHRLMEQPDYLALPTLVAEGKTFDLVFIDGYHSFDYTMIDVFYCDLLLKEGGILAIHDSAWPPVYRVLRFLELNKPYKRLSPPVLVNAQSWAARAVRRLKNSVSGPTAMREARSRRDVWKGLSAYQKLDSTQVPEDAPCDF